MYALGIRVCLASALILSLIYGFASGRLHSTAPWDRQLHPAQFSPLNQALLPGDKPEDEPEDEPEPSQSEQ